MEWRTLLYEKIGAVARITANRPHVLNAQSRVMIEELDRAFDMAVEDADTRAVIVAGAGAHFSSGTRSGKRGGAGRSGGAARSGRASPTT